MILNTEKISEFDIHEELHTHSHDGVCAMMRLQNEEEFIVPCLLAVRNFFDEFVIVYNKTTDATRELVEAVGLKNMRVYEYPFDVAFRGPDHVDVPVNSVHHSAFYYNWCLSKVQGLWVAKWDGDNIALPNFNQTRDLITSGKFKTVINSGWDLVGPDMKMVGLQPKVGYETRFFQKQPSVQYQRTGDGLTQVLSTRDKPATQTEPTFLHLKWAKKDPAMYWPKNWQNSPHFLRIAARHVPCQPYKGMYPQVLVDYMAMGKDPYKLLDMYGGDRDPVLATRGGW